jgi:hypothetical protein
MGHLTRWVLSEFRRGLGLEIVNEECMDCPHCASASVGFYYLSSDRTRKVYRKYHADLKIDGKTYKGLQVTVSRECTSTGCAKEDCIAHFRFLRSLFGCGYRAIGTIHGLKSSFTFFLGRRITEVWFCAKSLFPF